MQVFSAVAEELDLSVEEAFDWVDFSDPDDFDFEHKLIGEWAYEHFDHIPDEGDEFTYNGLRVRVASMKKHRIVSLRFFPPARETGEGGDAT